MLSRIASRRDRPVEDIASRRSAAARIAWRLVNRSKPYAVITKNDLFCAIAMMRIEVPDPNTLATCFESVIGGNRDRVQIAKTHSSRRSRVMPRRTHQREPFSTAERQVYRTDRRSGSTLSVFFDSGIERSISVKIDRPPKPRQVASAMDSQRFLFAVDPRLHPDPIRTLVPKASLRVDQPGWALRMIILAKPDCGFVENQSEHRSSVHSYGNRKAPANQYSTWQQGSS